MGQPVVHFEVLGKDAAALESFYSELFGWSMTMGPGDYRLVDTGSEGAIGGGIGAAPEGSPGGVTFYVQSDDVQADLDRATSLGGTRVMGPDEIPGDMGTIAVFADPEGHMIGLFNPPAGGGG